MAYLYNLKQRNNIIFIIMLFMGVFLIYAGREILTAILSAFILYLIFRELNIWLIEEKKINRSLSSILILILSFFIIILPVFTLISMVLNKLQELNSRPAYFERLFLDIDRFAEKNFHQANLVYDLFQKLKEFSVQVFSILVNSIANTLILVTLMYLILYYMFVNYKIFESTLIKYSPFGFTNTRKLASEARKVTFSNVLGQGIIAITQGCLLTLGFYAFGISDAIFWGVVTIFLSFLPFVGAPLIFIPAAIIEISNNKTGVGIALLIYGIGVISSIDNIIRLFISKRYANTHPLITIIGIVIGVPTFGIVGLVYGPLLISWLLLLIPIYQDTRQQLLIEESSKIR